MRYRFGEFELDVDRFELRRGAKRLAIEPTPLRLLLYMLERHPSAPSKDELLDNVWTDTAVGETALSRAIRAIRSALDESAEQGGVIQTVRGRGYGIGVPVEVIRPEDGGGDHGVMPIASEGFVGRVPELRRAAAALESAGSGTLQLVTLIGEPGIGKTRTAEEIARMARRKDATVLWGRAREGESAPPFWPWIQILRSYAGARAPEILRVELGQGAADVAAIAPEVVAGLGDLPERAVLEPREARFRLFDSVASLLRAASKRTPLVLVLDDLHWADEASILLLDFVLAELTRSRVLVIATIRNTEARSAALERLLTSAARATQHASMLPLGGLERDEIDALVRAELAEPMPPERIEALYRRCEGNPFYARELVMLAGDPAAASDVLEHAIPMGIEQVVRDRLTKLPEIGARLLQTAAVIGREFSVALVARAAATPADEVLDLLTHAERIRVVETTSSGALVYRFAHALIRETIHHALPSARRALLHRDVALALEAGGDAPSDAVLSALADHWLAALPAGDLGHALDVVVWAARRAAEQLAFEEVARLCAAATLALSAAPDAHARAHCALLELRAEALFRLGDHAASVGTLRELVQIARHAGDPVGLGRAAATLSLNQFFTATANEDLAGITEEALAGLPEGDDPLRVRLLAGLARQLTWRRDPARQQALLDEGVAMARRLGDDAVLLKAIAVQSTYVDRLDDVRRRRLYGEMETLARETGLVTYEADVAWLRLQHAIELALPGAVDRELLHLGELADTLRHPHYLAFAALARAVRALWRGDVHSAERLIGEAHAAGARSEPDFADQARAAQTLQLLRLRGQEKALAPAIREGAARFPMIATYRCALAAIELEVGRPEEAAALLHDLVDSGEDGGPLRPGEPNWDLNVALLAEVAAVVGEPRIAERILQALAPRRGRYLHVPNLVAAGCASHAIGLMAARLSRWDDAVEAFEEALVLERRLEAVPRIALVEAELSRALRRRGAAGDDEAAAGCAARAEEIAARPGLEGILSKVRAATAGESP